jgi:hypothetical protein
MELSSGDSHFTVPGSISKYDYFLDLVDTTAEQKHVGRTISRLLKNKNKGGGSSSLESKFDLEIEDEDEDEEEDFGVTPVSFSDIYDDYDTDFAPLRKKVGYHRSKEAQTRRDPDQSQTKRTKAKGKGVSSAGNDSNATRRDS